MLFGAYILNIKTSVCTIVHLGHMYNFVDHSGNQHVLRPVFVHRRAAPFVRRPLIKLRL